MLAILGPLAALMGLELEALKERLRRQAMLWGILGALGAIAIGFLLVALNSALTFAVGPVVAPLIIAAAALLISIVVYLVFSWRDSVEKRKEAEKQHSTEMTALITTAAITALPLLLPTLKKVGLPAGGAAAAIYFLLQSKALRRDHEKGT